MAADQTASVLRPWLGSDFVMAHAPLIQRISLRLSQFLPQRDSLAMTAQDLDSLLFMAVRDATGGRMLLRMDNDLYIRVKLADFAVMADELLYLLMEKLRVDAQSFLLIKDYSLHAGSLAALKALYLHYEAYQSQEEFKTIVRVIRTCHPPFRWRGWLQV
jgi:hypothetical protein